MKQQVEVNTLDNWRNVNTKRSVYILDGAQSKISDVDQPPFTMELLYLLLPIIGAFLLLFSMCCCGKTLKKMLHIPKEVVLGSHALMQMGRDSSGGSDSSSSDDEGSSSEDESEEAVRRAEDRRREVEIRREMAAAAAAGHSVAGNDDDEEEEHHAQRVASMGENMNEASALDGCGEAWTDRDGADMMDTHSKICDSRNTQTDGNLNHSVTSNRWNCNRSILNSSQTSNSSDADLRDNSARNRSDVNSNICLKRQDDHVVNMNEACNVMYHKLEHMDRITGRRKDADMCPVMHEQIQMLTLDPRLLRAGSCDSHTRCHNNNNIIQSKPHSDTEREDLSMQHCSPQHQQHCNQQHHEEQDNVYLENHCLLQENNQNPEVGHLSKSCPSLL